MIVADTHAWLWWLSNRALLSAAARAALASDVVAVSPLSFWEIAMLARKGRIVLDAPPLPWLRDAVAQSATTILELSLDIAAAAGALDNERLRDPADRIIVATTMHYGAVLVTKDDDIRASGVVSTIW